MPKKVFRIRKFEGGLNEVSDPKDLEEGQFSDVQDVSFDKLGQARTIGAGTAATGINPLDGATTIEPGFGLHYFSSSYSHNPTNSIAHINDHIYTEAKDGVKAYGRISVIGGYLNTNVIASAAPNFVVKWTSTSGGHAAVTITDNITGWFGSSYIHNNQTQGSLKADSLQTLIHNKFTMDSESTPNFTSTVEGVNLKIEHPSTGTTNDYDSDGAQENTAGVLSFVSVNSGLTITTGTNFTEAQKNKIAFMPGQGENQLGDLDDDYILLEINASAQHGGGDPGFIFLHKSDVANGINDTAQEIHINVGDSISDTTYIAGYTTTYSFTVFDDASGASQTTSLTTSGAANDTAGEVASLLNSSYSTHQNITSSVTNNIVKLVNGDAGAAHAFSVTTRVTHTGGNLSTGENYIAYVSKGRKLYVYRYDSDGDGTNAAWTDKGTIANWATDSPKVHMYSADGALRIIDRNFSSNLVNAWYGHVGVGSVWSNNATYGGWKMYKQALTFDEADIRTDGQTAVGTIGSDDKVHISITQGSADTGFWNDKYKFYVSAVFNDGQESLPSKVLGFTSDPILDFGENTNKSLIIDIGVRPDSDEPFDNGRITGFSIYYAKELEGYGTYYWLGTIDQVSGWLGADNQTAALSDNGSQADIAAVTIPSDDTQFTYESRGFASPLNTSIHAFDGTDGLQYKTSCIAKSRLFVGNLKYNGQSHSSEMCVTPWRKYDTFPIPYGIITVNNDDADAIVHLEAAGDRILQYKENNLYIINVSEIGSEVVEGSYKYKGVTRPYHVCKVEEGVAWCNKSGVFLYNSNSGDIQDLMYPKNKDTGKRIKTSTWTSFFSDNSVIGYDSIRKQLIVKKSVADNSTSGDIYYYDFTVDAWSYGYRRFANNKKVTNMITTKDGDMVMLKQGLIGDDFDNGGEVPT